ncbi:DedA family protein [Thalassospira sp. CH_XMU1448-2]|uniref:DedA family protein n=1 Tax=Thalassospira sp. CH_XMU1448-2 TaxID=3107773 RepID=UPI00300A7416
MFETINLWIQDHQQLVYTLIFTYCVSKASILPVFVGIFVVSESLLPGPSIVAMLSGAFVGDMIRFWLGRKYGDAIMRKLPDGLSKWLGKTMRLFEHYGVAYILLCRYPNTIRSISVFPVGMSSMSFMRFLPLCIASILLWVGIYFALGYVLGEGMSELLERNLTLLSPILLIVFLGLGWFGLKRIDKLEQQAERAIK